MAGHGGVIRLNVELEILVQVILAQEGNDRLGVVVVLMPGRLLRLGLDEHLTLEANLVLIVCQFLKRIIADSFQDGLMSRLTQGHSVQVGHVGHLAVKVRVKQGTDGFNSKVRNIHICIDLRLTCSPHDHPKS